jgi:hypothetical protein
MWPQLIAVVVLLLWFILIGVIVSRYLKSTKQDVNDKIKQVVDRYNSSSEYTYQFDKQQEKNIQNIESNMHQMFNNYAYVKNETLKLDETTVKKHALAKEVATDKVNVKKELQLGEFKMVERAPKEVLARADGKNWLFLYHSTSPDAGLTTNKIDADKVTANNAYVDSDLSVKGNSSVGNDWMMGEKWIMNVGGPGGSALQFAPKNTTNSKLWDRTKQVRLTNDGYVDTTNGGVVTRGAQSAHNPDGLNTIFPHAKDNKNYVRGDTQVDGELKVVGLLQADMVEKKGSTNGSDRSGLGNFQGGATRVYASGLVPGASVNLSVAKSATAYDDVVSVKQDKRVDVNGPSSFNERGSFKKELCIGSVCLKEANGVIQACKSDLTQCSPLQLATA